MPQPVPSAVIFDLDGTLVQTREASWEIFRPISEEFGLGIDSQQAFFDLLRDNLFAAIRRRCRDDDEAARVKDTFYRRLGEAYDPRMIPGMTAVVRTLAGHCPLSVISSNSMAVLRRILIDNGLSLCFAHVYGGDVVESKHEAINRILSDTTGGYGRWCQTAYAEEHEPTRLEPATTVLITDTAGDVRDARRAGIRAVGVSWGMHTPDELVAAGAEFVALWPEELLSYLLGAAATDPVAPSCRLPGSPADRSGARGDGSSNAGACCCNGQCSPGAPDVGAAAAVRLRRRLASAARASAATTPRLGTERTAASVLAAVRSIVR